MIRLWLNRIFGRWVKIDWDDIHDSPDGEDVFLPLNNAREHG